MTTFAYSCPIVGGEVALLCAGRIGLHATMPRTIAPSFVWLLVYLGMTSSYEYRQKSKAISYSMMFLDKKHKQYLGIHLQ